MRPVKIIQPKWIEMFVKTLTCIQRTKHRTHQMHPNQEYYAKFKKRHFFAQLKNVRRSLQNSNEAKIEMKK